MLKMMQWWPIFFSVFAQVNIFFSSSQGIRSYPQENSGKLTNYVNITSKLSQGNQIPGCLKAASGNVIQLKIKGQVPLPEERSNHFHYVHFGGGVLWLIQNKMDSSPFPPPTPNHCWLCSGIQNTLKESIIKFCWSPKFKSNFIILISRHQARYSPRSLPVCSGTGGVSSPSLLGTSPHLFTLAVVQALGCQPCFQK